MSLNRMHPSILVVSQGCNEISTAFGDFRNMTKGGYSLQRSRYSLMCLQLDASSNGSAFGLFSPQGCSQIKGLAQGAAGSRSASPGKWPFREETSWQFHSERGP
jgi:hypothetical protein